MRLRENNMRLRKYGKETGNKKVYLKYIDKT